MDSSSEHQAVNQQPVISYPVSNLQPPLQMPLGRNDLVVSILAQPQSLPLTPQLCLSLALAPKLLNQRTRHSIQAHVIEGMAKVRHAVSLLAALKRHTVHRRLEQPVCPVAQQISDIHEDRRVRQSLRARIHWHGNPRFAIASQ